MPQLNYKSGRGQCIVMLMVTLHELHEKESRSGVTKAEAISYIQNLRWFNLKDEDNEPYPANEHASREPRWHTLIAWARKDGVEMELVSSHSRDEWGMTLRGRNTVEKWMRTFRAGEKPVNDCYLWGADFKKFMCPAYTPSKIDVKRPALFYRDALLTILDEMPY